MIQVHSLELYVDQTEKLQFTYLLSYGLQRSIVVVDDADLVLEMMLRRAGVRILEDSPLHRYIQSLTTNITFVYVDVSWKYALLCDKWNNVIRRCRIYEALLCIDILFRRTYQYHLYIGDCSDLNQKWIKSRSRIIVN
jgi:hypothetical protein